MSTIKEEIEFVAEKIIDSVTTITGDNIRERQEAIVIGFLNTIYKLGETNGRSKRGGEGKRASEQSIRLSQEAEEKEDS